MEFRFTVEISEVSTPAALHCSRKLSDHIWESLDEYDGVHMRHGRKVEENRFEFVWEMGLNDDPQNFAQPDWIVSCVPADGSGDDEDSDSDGASSIIAAVGRTIGDEGAGESDEDVPF